MVVFRLESLSKVANTLVPDSLESFSSLIEIQSSDTDNVDLSASDIIVVFPFQK